MRVPDPAAGITATVLVRLLFFDFLEFFGDITKQKQAPGDNAPGDLLKTEATLSFSDLSGLFF